MTLTTAFPHSERHAQLVWYDPGATTGIVALAVRPAWLDGSGTPDAEGLRKAVTACWHGQVGRDAKVLDEDSGRARRETRVVAKPTGTANRLPFDRAPALCAELDAIKQCEAVLDMWPDAAWGYEDFIPNPGAISMARDWLAPVRMFSALVYTEMAYGERGRVPFVQGASMAKTTATDPRLSAAGLYRPGMPHATDAARHAFTFLRRARADAELRHMAWPKLFKEPELAERRIG